ncbi:MAG: hypothetical protein AB7V13_07140 [Pseudorhodoplanes sp.]|uniref:hypothetical protein n=1 Tax=Pseudorhodoplanes sp. TaxID=1934341 RepID=UPI003D0A108E
MSPVAKIMVAIAALGALAIWVYGALAYIRTLQAIRASDENAGMTWHAIFNWLGASGRLKGEAALHAAKVNRAVYGFLICVVVAAAAAIFTAVPSEPVR